MRVCPSQLSALVAAGLVICLSACRVAATQAVDAKANTTSTHVNGEHQPMDGQKQFQLDILDGNWGSLRLGYDLQTAWSALQKSYSSIVALTLTEDDVQRYNWTEQSLALTPQASQAVIDKFARNDEERSYPESALDQRAFIVVLNGNPVYGGVFMHPMSSMGISFPVIYASNAKGNLTLALRPVQSVLGDYTSLEPGWNGIKDPKIRDVFAKVGKLVS